MKKCALLFILSLTFLVCITSCTHNSGYYFIEGEFYSEKNTYNKEYEDYNADYQSAKLIIKEIDREAYLSANGLNVVKDISEDRIGDYYSVELYVFSTEKEEYIQLNYYNLKREPHVHTIFYRDEKESILSPLQLKNSKNSNWKYSVGHKGYWGEFYLRDL